VIVRVASWNLFHGRALPAVRRDLFPDYAAALGGADWDVCGLQEVPPWWVRPLAEACGASARGARTSLLRGALPQVQRAVSAPDPERVGVRGAAVNVLLVRPSAGRIVERRVAALRRTPQRRTVHAVRIDGPAGKWWLGNVHTHNRPVEAASRDLGRALRHMRAWAMDDEPTVLLGDLNVPREIATAVAAEHGFEWLAGNRVDHVLGIPPVHASGQAVAMRPRTLDRTASLSDHRFVVAPIALPE
jgi:endonuclease/exonuclease/phosphatase family metal-dependent hydrolase